MTKDLTASAAAAVAGAALGSLPLDKLHGVPKVAYAAVPGALGATVAWFSLADEPAATRTRVTALVAGALVGAQALSVSLDRAATTWLARRGVSRPRVVMAVVAAAATGLSQYWEGRSSPADPSGDEAATQS